MLSLRPCYDLLSVSSSVPLPLFPILLSLCSSCFLPICLWFPLCYIFLPPTSLSDPVHIFYVVIAGFPSVLPSVLFLFHSLSLFSFPLLVAGVSNLTVFVVSATLHATQFEASICVIVHLFVNIMLFVGVAYLPKCLSTNITVAVFSFCPIPCYFLFS